MRIGIDLGGTKIEVIALDPHGATLVRYRLPTPAGDYLAILDTIAELVRYAERDTAGEGTIGIASPGAESKITGLMKNSNSTILNGKPLREDLVRRLQRPVRIANDANCFALSEAIDGAAAEADTVFGVILGTGVGGGIVTAKTIITGRNGIAGEWGHNPLPWPAPSDQLGRDCYCGKTDCIECFLSGSGLVADYTSNAKRAVTAREIAALADAGDAQANQCIQTYKGRLARSLAAVINVLDPDVIVLGGGLSNIPQLYLGLTAMIAQHAFSDGIDTPVVRACHGDSSGVRGAACLWPAERRD